MAISMFYNIAFSIGCYILYIKKLFYAYMALVIRMSLAMYGTFDKSFTLIFLTLFGSLANFLQLIICG